MRKWKTTWQTVGDALALGASISFAVFIGAAIGYGIDRALKSYLQLDTFPYFSIIFFVLGIAAAGKNVWIAVRKELERDRGREDE